jgi:endoglucanase
MRGDYLPQTRRDFLRTSTLAAAGLMLSAQAALPATDTLGVSATRLERLRAGANLCRWFRFPRNETAEFFRDYIPDSEAEMMTRIGLKHVRLCVAPKEIMDATTGAVREDRAKLLEAAIRRLQRAGLLVMVDIHNEDRAAELDPDWQNAFMKFWSALAGRFAAFDPELTMLEIINEPVFSGREQEWNTLNARLAAVIREKAPQHTIVTSGPNWGGIDGLQKLTLLPDRNVIYSFHCYDPFPFTHQGATWAGEGVKPLRQVPYPSSPDAVMPLLSALQDKPESKGMLEKYGRERWNKDKLAARFQQGVAWGAKHGVPLYCGEFGVFPRFAESRHRAQWFADFGRVLATHRIGWAVWGWDEGFGLDRRHVDGKLVIDPVVAQALDLKTV